MISLLTLQKLIHIHDLYIFIITLFSAITLPFDIIQELDDRLLQSYIEQLCNHWHDIHTLKKKITKYREIEP